jgi:beta-lactamase class A
VPKSYKAPVIERPTELQSILDAAVSQTLSPFAGVKPEEVTATLIDLRDPSRFRIADVRGEQRIYPASVVKLFYMAALERQLEDGKVTMTPELARGLRDMIVVSSNEATQYILDVITDTSSGAELPKDEFGKWQAKRNRVNRYFTSMGYQNININQKTFCEDAYGVEQQTRNYKGENRNMLTTDATARLLAEIVTGRMNTPERTHAMMDLLSRDWSKPSTDPDNQAVGFTGKLLIDRKMSGAKLWSKAGWTSTARHDAAYIETPDGLKFVLVVFTENHANEKEIITSIAGKVIDGLERRR